MPLERQGARIQENREIFGRGGSATRYVMRQRMIAIGDDFWIENAQGKRAFEVDGEVLCKIQERMLRIKDSMEVKGPNGKRLRMVSCIDVASRRQSNLCFQPHDGQCVVFLRNSVNLDRLLC